MNDINNNESHKLVNFSHVLLNKIVEYLSNNIDKIFFSLVCKRWFKDRERYLKFRFDHMNLIDQQSSNRIFLNSYQLLINNAINQKNNCTLLFGKEDDTNELKCDYIISPDKLRTMNAIQSNINKIILLQGRRYEPEEIMIGKSDLEHLYRLISNSNVTKLNGCRDLYPDSPLPTKLKSISFRKIFNQPLFKDCLPSALKKLKFCHLYNQPLEPGVLPDTLEKLIFDDEFNQPFEPGVLPASLKVLSLRGRIYDQQFKVGSLPPNLEVLEYYGVDTPISEGVLPKTLHTLDCARLSWIPHIKSLPNLKVLKIYLKASYELPKDTQIDLGCIPSSVEKLFISAPSRLFSAMPPSIKHLSISQAQYDIDEIFPDRSRYHFETLEVCAFKLESLENLDIKKLKLQTYYSSRYINGEKVDRSKIRPIPNGVEFVNFGYTNQKLFENEHSIPSSVKVLKVPMLDCFTRSKLIPSTLEHLKISMDCEIKLRKNILPSSIQKLTLPKLYLPSPMLFNKNKFSTTPTKSLCIRKLDDQYFIVFGQTYYSFIASIFHKSEYNDRDKFTSIKYFYQHSKSAKSYVKT
ncbi:hypothetical protein PPL_07696 [Heterostelium album PN500]|uniref:COI1 F-box domain-containing protein n=1 Tax=Heterostelium pallidum (strain ATCC 26659 / Pp 5 / PN500) TaxID=670386 RepID=D3BGP4_HETP5|nr:hypothetical protein PPL_07696 [Heterostelium album PN500]EFA79278.1 hypothetical protein PPL_07696 [Heterostelium album PN500]|eukprot:XP_020431399.1 hypothetical protein PPL_07696 [Heterostelium album PN500]